MAPWTCPSCGRTVTSPFCPGCGERPITPLDLSLKGIAAQLMKTVGGVDGRLMRSIRALLGRPGSLTQAYAEGRRKPLVGPFQAAQDRRVPVAPAEIHWRGRRGPGNGAVDRPGAGNDDPLPLGG